MNKDIIGKIMKGRIIRKTETNYMIEMAGGLIGLIPAYQVRQYSIDTELEGLVVKPVLTPTGIQYKMSRDVDYIQKAFEEIVPYLKNGRVKIEKIARIPSQKTKIAVAKSNPSDTVNPAAVCIGEGGTYVLALQEKLDTKEFVDIIEWSDKADKYIANALRPGEVQDVIVDFPNRTATALINEEQTGLILGKKGVNLRLATKLTDFTILIEENGAYIREFGFSEKTTLELLKAKINTSDRLVELFETSNKDHKISKEAFDEVLETCDFVDEDSIEEDESEFDLECPECGHAFTIAAKDSKCFFCPHCGQKLELDDEEEEEAE